MSNGCEGCKYQTLEYPDKPCCNCKRNTDYADLYEPKKGKWITHKNALGMNYTACSNCNSVVALKLKNGSFEQLDMTDTNFCPICGADMR